jgi:arylsulfatase A-like enzyme
MRSHPGIEGETGMIGQWTLGSIMADNKALEFAHRMIRRSHIHCSWRDIAMFRSRIWFLLAIVAVVSTPLAAVAESPRKPNIIFILADDLGIPAIGCYGGAYKTPNLDALAASGTRFENCFAAPLCAPSRALLMTGRYAFRTGVIDNGHGAAATPDKDGCVALLLKEAGYKTAVAGKWRQLSYFTSKEDGAKWGFDEFLIWGAGLPDDEGDAKPKKKKNAADGEGKAKPDRYWDPDYNLNGKMLKDADGKYGPDVLNEFVIDFVRRHKAEPFFVYYPTPLIHGPILPTPDSKSQDKKKLKKKKDADNVGKGSVYADNIEYLDKQIGKLVAELDALKLRDNTLIVFTGDNGSVPVGTINGQKIEGHKHTMLEGGSRVPLIANWRGVTPSGVVLKDLVDFSDFLPTFVELAGMKLPTTRPIDGRSFAPQLLGKPGQPRDWAYVHLGNRRYVRSDRWKLTNDGKFFDMQEAPFREILVPAEKESAEAKAARTQLQVTLDHLIAQDKDAGNTPKKRKK